MFEELKVLYPFIDPDRYWVPSKDLTFTSKGTCKKTRDAQAKGQKEKALKKRRKQNKAARKARQKNR